MTWTVRFDFVILSKIMAVYTDNSRETKPYDITDTGISVYDQANIF
ncbi:hypothetical protein DM2_2039 [Halorubrum sp. DM2]|nr:hypothetical protein DM2_2039 [Halorubrum sp. DM2]